MARRYEVDELLWLRNSPLVTRPEKLPPIEEWMGPIPDPTTQRKSTHAKDPIPNETTNRKPSLFDTRHISRNSASEDLILGPPKTAFASASRIYGGKGSIDATDRPSRFNDTDDAKNDRYNFREKFFKERDAGDKDVDRRDNKYGGINGRRGDRDEWSSGRPRRTFGPEEQDPRVRRNGDSERWDARDRDPNDLGYSRGLRDKDGRFDKEGRLTKRDTPLRGRHEQSWFRDEGDAAELEEDKPSVRTREWRRDRQAPDREWNRGLRPEHDPEWMDATDPEEPKQAHTQEDFQRWKERMKAGSTQAPPEEKKEKTIQQVAPDLTKAEAKHLEGELFARNQQVETGFEKFFGLLSDAKPTPQEVVTPGSAESNKRDSASIKASKSSRFAGFFSPPPESPSRGPDTAPISAQPDRPVSTDADQEGFQRILQMLGGSKSGNTTPQVDITQQPRPPSYVQPEPSRPSPPGLASPTRDSFNRQHEFMTSHEGVTSRGSRPPRIDSIPPPSDAQAQLRDRENLLRLMQQVKISPGAGQQHTYAPSLPPQASGHTPGILNVPDLLSRPQGMQKMQKNQPFLDDPAIANMQRPDTEMQERMRRPANGPPMGYFDDDMSFLVASQEAQGPKTPAAGGRGPQGYAHTPMGLQRPPGFEQMLPPPPGWGGQIPHQQGGGPGALAPPPGIPTPSRGVNPNYLSGPLPMHGGNMPPPHERPPFPRGLSGSGTGGNFGPPPGMMPPPGYMNMNGPPPPSGFPPMSHNPDAAILNFPHGGPGNFSGGGGPGGPPPTSRHLLDMFAQVNGGDGRGGMPGHGPFR